MMLQILKTSDSQGQVQGATGNPANIIFADVPVCKAVLHVIPKSLHPFAIRVSTISFENDILASIKLKTKRKQDDFEGDYLFCVRGDLDVAVCSGICADRTC